MRALYLISNGIILLTAWTPLDSWCQPRKLSPKRKAIAYLHNSERTSHTQTTRQDVYLRTEFAIPNWFFPFKLNPCIIWRCPSFMRSFHTVINSFLVSVEHPMFTFPNVLKRYCFPLWIIIDASHSVFLNFIPLGF